MKKKVIVILSVFLLALGIVSLKQNFNTKTDTSKLQSTSTTKVSSIKLSGLSELKSKSEIIVEIIGTDKCKTIDYKGATSRVTTVKVTDVIKGDKKLNEINIIQMDGEVRPENGQKLVMFLRKGVDNPDCYVPIGSTQGIYKIVPAKFNTSSKVNSANSTTGNMILEPVSVGNDDILKDLSGNYADIKNKLK